MNGEGKTDLHGVDEVLEGGTDDESLALHIENAEVELKTRVDVQLFLIVSSLPHFFAH